MPRGTLLQCSQRRLVIVGLVLSITLVTGCASGPQTRQLLAEPNNLTHQTELSNTPFFPQQRYQCGPAALATALKQSGIDIDASSLVDEIYLPARKGSLQLEILASTRRHGRLPYRITPNMRALLNEVAAGNPVLVLQNLGLSWIPQWHYAVVIGFDLTRQIIILRSGTDLRHVTDMNTFELTWARSQHWGIVVMPAGKLPATVTAEQALRTIVASEMTLKNTPTDKQQWRNIHRAYDGVLSRWPGNLVAQMGQGNSAYQLGEINIAAQAFRNAVHDHPEVGAAHNNLAQVLMDQGKLTEAERHARQAVNLGGKNQNSFQTTLADIQRAKNLTRGDDQTNPLTVIPANAGMTKTWSELP